MSILMMALQLEVLPGAELKLPEPAMGNMKPSTEGYQEKWKEKRAKQREELKDEPWAVSIEQVAWLLPGGTANIGSFEDFCTYLHGVQKFEWIVSPRPSRDIKVIVCESWRRGFTVPYSFPYKGLNALRLFGTGAEDIMGACATPVEAVKQLQKVLAMIGPRIIELTE